MTSVCEVDWSALGTWAAVVVALGIAVSDSVVRYFGRRRQRTISASGLLNAIQLSKNVCRGLVPVLKNLGPGDRARLSALGSAIKNPHVGPIDASIQSAHLFEAKAAQNIAYATSLIYSIDKWGDHLATRPTMISDAEWELVVENAAFFAEAADQAFESLNIAESIIKGYVPREIMDRRFGPNPSPSLWTKLRSWVPAQPMKKDDPQGK